MNISDPFEAILLSVSPVQKTTGVDGKEYEYINIELKPNKKKTRSTGKKITKSIFTDSIAYDELMPLAEAAEEEDFNKYEKLLGEFNEIPFVMKKLTSKTKPYYVTEKKQDGSVVKAKYPEHLDQGGLDVIADDCTLFIFDEDDAAQEFDSWWRRLENRKLTVKPIDAKTLAAKKYNESQKVLLNKLAEEKGENTEAPEVKSAEEQENENPQ